LHAYVGAFMDGLVASGVREVCLAPGSRSTPLALEAWRHPQIRVWVHLDERSCGYFALGMAKASGAAVGLICTSGTAAVNFAPAVAEAFLSNVPLVVLTADRPPELRAVRAPQAIDQMRLYGSHVKRFVEMATPSGSALMVRYAGHWGARAASEATAAPRGPVHCNFPFREPLIPSGEPGEPGAAAQGRSAGERPIVDATLRPTREEAAAEVEWMRRVARGVIVCGPELPEGLAGPVTALARTLGWVVLADPLSQVRCGRHDRSLVVDSYDALLRDPAVAASLRPGAVLRFGGPPTSKTLGEFLDGSGASQVLVMEGEGWSDPSMLAERAVRSDPVAFCEVVLEGLGGALVERPGDGWTARWREMDDAAGAAMADHFASDGALSEPRLMAELSAVVGDGATVFAGSSMPVRDLDGFFMGSERRVRFLANRGASGIDGVVSSALGVAAVSTGSLVLVVGDVSFYHDMNGLLAASGSDRDVTIVVVNNDGGGIFSFLPQAVQVAEFEPLFGTPHGLTFEAAASLYGLGYGRVEGVEALRGALAESIGAKGTRIIEVPSDRQVNVKQHEAVWEAVAARLGASTDGP
jgi:2-succinyl-5-enolpyruvyl-6-hydroxy-3-cyclohexene-1-carboxylate synthase